MATLVLSHAGAALGGLLGPAGAAAGRLIGAAAGSVLDEAVFGTDRRIEGPRLSDLEVQSSTEGQPISRVYGRARLAGQLIWATRFQEVTNTTTTGRGGKGGPSATTMDYAYFANFAVALCEGPIARIGRIWADGTLMDRHAITFRVYTGEEDQEADSLILAKQSGDAPAYRGTAYVVFEGLPLEPFGNRLPQLAFEVFRPLDTIGDQVRAVNLIPGSTEFGYDTLPVSRQVAAGSTQGINVHVERGVSDWTASLDELQALCPNLTWVTLVVAWFGDDLRAGECKIHPKVSDPDTVELGATWSVAGLTRDQADTVTLFEGRPAYGGTPSDGSVIRAIQDLKARGLKVMLAPFILMDITADNTKTDPHNGATGQPAYPWRGQITCNPAPGLPSTVDQTAVAAAQVAAFLGAAQASDFSVWGKTVTYSGTDDWHYNRMILHNAALAAAAGGVDGVLIGSEMPAMTQVRSSPVAFPFVEGLVALAAMVRTLVGPDTKISYAANWSEYFGYHPDEGSGDIFFHLDTLWADMEIDFIGIDMYMPVTDWRDEAGHADEAFGRAPDNADYVLSGISSGEGFDWYYASDADRQNQVRTEITDGAHGKPWVFRYKDLASWWSSMHYDRPLGVEASAPTDWLPESKPIWFTELGCPAVDKVGNQPNRFIDPKSANSGLPHFSCGRRDDGVQRAYMEAYQRAFDTGNANYAGLNAQSGVYSGPMVDPDHLHFWAWDARPYPIFPLRTDIWSDGDNWETGHWLNGRLSATGISALIAAILTDYGYTKYLVDDLAGTLDGYVINHTVSARQALEPVLAAFAVDAAESGDTLRFRGRGRPPDALVTRDDVVDRPEEPLFSRIRAQESELPSEITLRFIDSDKDYRISAVTSRRRVGQSRRTRALDVTACLPAPRAESLSETYLGDVWAGRELIRFRLPATFAAIEAGDILELEFGTFEGRVRVESIVDTHERALTARGVENRRYASAPLASQIITPATIRYWGAPQIHVIEMAPGSASEDPLAPSLAIFADPWPGTVAIFAGAVGGAPTLRDTSQARSVIGELLTDLSPGPAGRIDLANAMSVRVSGGTLQSLPDTDVLAGGNLCAVQCTNGEWEVLQFASATLTGLGTYDLSRLIRAHRGTEDAMEAGAAQGAAFVLLTDAVVLLSIGEPGLGLALELRVGPAQDDYGQPTYTTSAIVPQGRGLRPFRPVHLRADRDRATSDITLSWIRRTRFGGDSWALVEVPLNEQAESYQVDIIHNETSLRTLFTHEPRQIYTHAQQLADFGAIPTSLTVSVAQLGATIGAGISCKETFDV